MRQQEREGFEEFARARSSELLRAAWLLTGDRHAGEDLVQDALARVYTRWDRVRAAQSPAAYARTVLLRVFLDSTRRRSTTEVVRADLDERVALDDDVDLRRTIVAVLATLPPLDRAVVVHRYLFDHDVVTVATDLGLTANAVRTRASRALARVREQLGPDFSSYTTQR